MLAELAIRDIVLIDRLDIEFPDGLTVLTGETGAGKSIVLDALSLALGARGSAELVRAGAEQGQVTAVFELEETHPAKVLLRDNELDGDGPLVIRRIQNADGRTRAFVNDQPASLAFLKSLAGTLVELHGQHDDRAMVAPATHRLLLDAFGGLDGQAAAVRQAWRDWRAAEADAATLKRRIEAARAEADYLRAAASELSQLAPQEGEETELAAKRHAMMQAEKVAGDIAEARDIVGGPASPIPALSSLARRLERKREQGATLLDPTIEALDRALDALGDAEGALDEAMRATEFDPKALERAEERLFALRAAARKHNVPVEALAALAERMTSDLASLDSGEEKLEAMLKAAREARDRYDAEAGKLSRGRKKAAKALEAAVGAELPALKLERAAFEVKLDTDAEDRREEGVDAAEFWVRTNPGTRPGPMMKVASGGELSRFLLALKVALADRGSAPTLIFDEIDTAVGGAVADAIGQRLARLAERVQVLAVTHAPQVAAKAGRHFLIAKDAGQGQEPGRRPRRADRVITQVTALDDLRRREEIARMLSGSEVTDEARAAAERLIGAAG
jgi:DNA repair protein RecN (Recombination protein N)